MSIATWLSAKPCVVTRLRNR
ncbi:hypothetical protein MED222_05585 [Vibrio sp. MED222]|nr:hypothetical protein MED222_05585 [Vibrio sp. MED222]